MIYAADFETNNHEDDCRVWAWCICNIAEPDNCELGNEIDTFIDYISNREGICYFHNLKFDGNFILSWLFRNGYKYIEKSAEDGPKGKRRKKLEPGTFTSLISDMGIWYSLTVCWATGKEIEFRDSAKLIPLAVSKIPAAFNLKESKGNIDYQKRREKGHELTEEEKEYVKGDVIIIALAISIMISNGQKKMTAASNALNDYKTRIGKKNFSRLFPSLDIMVDDSGVSLDKKIRASYKGGWTYLNPRFKDMQVEAGLVYDVNSMYPWAMHECVLPYGMPVYEKGKPEKKPRYPLYIVQFVAVFSLKQRHYPSLQLKGSSYFAENEYIEYSQMPVGLTLTNVDYELMLENYDVEVIEWIGTLYFHGRKGMFDEYIDNWYAVKEESSRNGNGGMKTIAKLMLNSLYGKFGAKLEGRSKIPYYDEEAGIVRFKKSENEKRKGVYMPVATFITSYCRDKIIRSANAVYDRFIYADTDSIHVIGTEPVSEIEIDDYRLGAFKCESEFIRARFIRQKTYMEITEEYSRDENGVLQRREKKNLKCAGMPDAMKATVEESDFYGGAEFPIGPDSKFAPKLSPKIVPGGVILREMPFQIK